MYIVNSRYVAQHCSLTKPQPGNDLITAVWLVNGGLLNWASIAFRTLHASSTRSTTYQMVAKNGFDPVLVPAVYLSVS